MLSHWKAIVCFNSSTLHHAENYALDILSPLDEFAASWESFGKFSLEAAVS